VTRSISALLERRPALRTLSYAEPRDSGGAPGHFPVADHRSAVMAADCPRRVLPRRRHRLDRARSRYWICEFDHVVLAVRDPDRDRAAALGLGLADT